MTPARRMLTAQEAADYCGFKSVNGFTSYIPVAPVKFGSNVRYDRAALDRHLDAISTSTGGLSPSERAGNVDKGRGR